MFGGKTILITGGTGSFGNAVLKKFLAKEHQGDPRLQSRRKEAGGHADRVPRSETVEFYIGDARDIASIRPAMIDVDYVFHAAALKQVPSCEFFPLQAVRTNILGASNVLDAAVDAHVRRVIVLSTDKAVYPINAMGMSKALMEKVTVAKSRHVSAEHPTLCATRYGNVMASRGSVIPLFMSQIKTGRALTVTDPQMTRFLMSLDQSVELVLFAYENAAQGDIFVQKAPASTIETLFLALMKIFNKNVDVRIIGTRHGEKKSECLVSREEMARAVDLGGFFRIPSDDRDLDYSKYFVSGAQEVSSLNDYTSDNTRILNVNETAELLLSLDYIQNELSS